jgi:hypothetical protein
LSANVGRHFAVVLKIDPLAVKYLHGLDDARRTLACGMSERGEGEKRQPGFIAKPARDTGGFDRDVGNLLRIRHFGHGRVGDQHRSAAGHDDRYTDHAVPWLGIDHVADVFECDREIACHTGDQRIGVAERDHAGRQNDCGPD